MGQNWAKKLGFLPLSKFGLLVFFEIAYNDSLQQCLTSSTGKIHEKYFWAQRGQIWVETRFFVFFSSLVH